MSRYRPRRRHLKGPLADEVAAAVNDNHAQWLAEGLYLTASSAVYYCRDGTLTLRLVYRDRARRRSATVTVRRVPSS